MTKPMGPIGPSRSERIRTEGSPPFRARLGAITAGAQTVVDLEEGASGKYAPFDNLVITNNSDEELSLTLSGRTFRVLAREERVITDMWFRQFIVKNEDGATSTGANEIEYIAERKPTDADSMARKLAKALP